MKKFGTITGTRNGKKISKRVRVEFGDESCTWGWVRSENGKPLFGTTGYICKDTTDLLTFRSKLLIADYTIEYD